MLNRFLTGLVISFYSLTCGADGKTYLDPHILESLLIGQIEVNKPCEDCNSNEVRLKLDNSYEGYWQPWPKENKEGQQDREDSIFNLLIAKTLIDQQLRQRALFPVVEKEYQGIRGVFRATSHPKYRLKNNLNSDSLLFLEFLIAEIPEIQNSFATIKNNILEKLKETTEDQWRVLLGSRLSSKKLTQFLQRRTHVLNQYEKLVGAKKPKKITPTLSQN